MIERIKAWFKKGNTEPSPEELSPDFLLGFPKESNWPGNFPRSYKDRPVACDVRDCVRPSAFTVLSYADVDVDVPGNTQSRLNKSKQILDIYAQYRVCDRCFRSDKDGVRSKATYIEGPEMEYNPDKDKKTQEKLKKMS